MKDSSSKRETTSKFNFDPDRLAHLEIAGWKAYYERRWDRMLSLVVKLNREQFGMSIPHALLGAYYIVRASVAWVPSDHDLNRVGRNLARFYSLARKGGYKFDPRLAARLELRYWDLNRRFAATPFSAESPMIESLAHLHAEVFGVSTRDAWKSAEGRAMSLHLVGRVSSKQSTDIDADWLSAEAALRDGYRDLKAHLRA